MTGQVGVLTEGHEPVDDNGDRVVRRAVDVAAATAQYAEFVWGCRSYQSLSSRETARDAAGSLSWVVRYGRNRWGYMRTLATFFVPTRDGREGGVGFVVIHNFDSR